MYVHVHVHVRMNPSRAVDALLIDRVMGPGWGGIDIPLMFPLLLPSLPNTSHCSCCCHCCCHCYCYGLWKLHAVRALRSSLVALVCALAQDELQLPAPEHLLSFTNTSDRSSSSGGCGDGGLGGVLRSFLSRVKSRRKKEWGEVCVRMDRVWCKMMMSCALDVTALSCCTESFTYMLTLI